MSDDLAIARQSRQDREYLAACKAAGIEPEPAKYKAALTVCGDDVIDAALHEGQGAKNGRTYVTRSDEPQPLAQLPPGAEGATRVLDLLIPRKAGALEFVQTAGRRCLALAWLLGRRPEPLAELARQLGVSRASLSTYVRALEDKTGVHGRGQKASGTVTTYRDNAKRSWKLRKLNTLLADASAE
jgi:DNA-binding CsgD family transcriptional regulator